MIYFQQLKITLCQPKYKERLIIKAKGGIYLLETSHVAYIQITDEITFAYDDKGNRYPLKENLNQLEELLDPAIFFRINRSEMINIYFVEKLAPYFNDRLVIKLKSLNVSLISSVTKTPALKKWLDR
jgi:DNA-binding LytR/AlgR family response regulator